MIQNKSHNSGMSKTFAPRPPFPLRMPDEMRDSLESESKKLGRSLNSEIIARLQSSFDAETVADSTTSTGMVITIDSRGYPISWSEIAAYVDSLRQMTGIDPRSLEINVITPELADSEGKDPKYDAIERNLKEFYRKKRAAQPTSPAPAEASGSPRDVFVKGPSGKSQKTLVITKNSLERPADEPSVPDTLTAPAPAPKFTFNPKPPAKKPAAQVKPASTAKKFTFTKPGQKK